MKKNILLLAILLASYSFSQPLKSVLVTDQVVFQKDENFYLQLLNNKSAEEMVDFSTVQAKIWNDELVRFPAQISKELLIKEEWVFYSGIQSPYNSNKWLCLERTIMGNDFNLFLFDTERGTKKIIINNTNSIGNFAFRPVSWSVNEQVIYIELLEFDTGLEHEGVYSYDIESGELKKLAISEKYMTTPLISPDRKHFLFTATSLETRELIHGIADQLKVYSLEKREEILLSETPGENIQALGWYSNEPLKKKQLLDPNENIAQLNFKLPWVSGLNYCVTRDGSNAAPGSAGSSSSCSNLGPHSYPSATDFDTPNNADDKVLAVAAGTVTSVVYSNTGYGNCIVITHSDGYRTRYGHNKSIAVTQGQQVQQGCYISIEGTTGNSSGDHIHFEYEYPGGSGNLYATFSDCGGCVPHRGYSYTSTNSLQSCNTINPPPAPTVSSTNTCGNKTIVRASPPSGITYYWQGTSCGTSTSNSAASYTVTASGTYYLRAKSTGGVWSTCSSITVAINVLPVTPPVPSVSTNVCGAKTLTRVTPPAGVTYYWQTICGVNVSNSSPTYTAPLSGTYRLRAKSAAGCWSSNCAAVSVLVNPDPSPSISGQNSVCSNSNGVAYSVINTGNNFSWTINGGTIVSGQNTNSITVNWAAPGNGTLSITETNPSSNCFATASLNVNIGSNLNPTISVNGPLTFCQGGNVMLDASAGFNSYLWSNGDTTQIINVTTNGTYSVTVTGINGCVGTSASPVSVIVNAPPQVPTILAVDSVLTSSSSVGNQWCLDSVIINGAESQTHIMGGQGIYTVIVTDSATGCSAVSAPLNSLNVGVEKAEAKRIEAMVTIYPNPNNGSFTIQFNNLFIKMEMALVNVLGEQVYFEKLKANTSEHAIENIAQGIYFIQILADGNLYNKKIVVQ
ncbi:MAG: peptidoglycan DD-metalloendopeptidase family protein [Bacteroidota bacterium]